MVVKDDESRERDIRKQQTEHKKIKCLVHGERFGIIRRTVNVPVDLDNMVRYRQHSNLHPSYNVQVMKSVCKQKCKASACINPHLLVPFSKFLTQVALRR